VAWLDYGLTARGRDRRAPLRRAGQSAGNGVPGQHLHDAAPGASRRRRGAGRRFRPGVGELRAGREQPRHLRPALRRQRQPHGRRVPGQHDNHAGPGMAQRRLRRRRQLRGGVALQPRAGLHGPVPLHGCGRGPWRTRAPARRPTATACSSRARPSVAPPDNVNGALQTAPVRCGTSPPPAPTHRHGQRRLRHHPERSARTADYAVPPCASPRPVAHRRHLLEVLTAQHGHTSRGGCTWAHVRRRRGTTSTTGS
jgi:hypothetical protein